MDVRLQREVLQRELEPDLWNVAAVGFKQVEMPCAPQVGWTVVIGAASTAPRVEKVTYVVRTGLLHVLLESVKVESDEAADSAIRELEGLGFEIQRWPRARRRTVK